MPSHEPSRRRRASASKGALLLAAALGLAAGCRDRCTAESQQTQARLKAARTAGADAYASEVLSRAADLFAKAEQECRKQRSRFFLARSYSLAADLYVQSREEAEKAIREARTNQGIARQEALNARYSATQAVEEARTSLVRAQKTRGEGAVLDLLDGLQRLRQGLADLQKRIDGGEFLAARDLGARIIQDSVRLQAVANSRTLGARR